MTHGMRFALVYGGVVTLMFWLLSVLLWPPVGAGLLALGVLGFVGAACWEATRRID